VPLEEEPITIKEGSDYAVELKFKSSGVVITDCYESGLSSTFCTAKLEMRKKD
jgi:hypothetical protein